MGILPGEDHNMGQMDVLEKFSVELRERIMELDHLRFKDPVLTAEKADWIYERALEEGNHEAVAYADFYSGDAAYSLCEGEKCIFHVQRAIPVFEKYKNWSKVSSCHNLLGVLFSNQGDVTTALASFDKAMEVSQKYKDPYSAALVYENLCEVCDNCQNYEEALEYAAYARESIIRCKDNPRWGNVYVIVLTSMAKVYLRLKRYEEATGILCEIDLYRAQFGTSERELDENVVRLLWTSHEAHEKEDECVTATMDSFDQCSCRMDYFMYILIFMGYLKKKNRIRDLDHVIDVMEQNLQGIVFPQFQVRMSDFKVDLLLQKKEESALVEELLKYRKYFTLQQKQNNQVLRYYMDMQRSLAHTRQDNLRLQHRMGIDELTGIANRRKLDEKAREMYAKACEQQSLFAVEMLDIDKFKQINDHYGHVAGDACLKTVADVLHEMEEDNFFCSRFGGDEFVILFFNTGKELIYQKCKAICSKISALSKRRELPDISVSQGVCCGSADFLRQNIQEYMNAADRALYQSKEKGSGEVSFALFE